MPDTSKNFTGNVTGLTTNSFRNMQLDAGAFFVGLDTKDWTPTTSAKEVGEALNAAKKENKCLGATTGGGAFRLVPETREIEADGMRAPIVGSTVFDGWDVGLTTTLKETTESNLHHIIATAEKDPTTGALRVRNVLEVTDYIPNVVWAGKVLGGALMVVEIENALNISGMEFTFQDKGEGTIAVDYKAHQDDLENMEYAPCNIWVFAGDEQVAVPDAVAGTKSVTAPKTDDKK